MKSSQSIWHLLHTVKSTVKISTIFVAFLENLNFNSKKNNKVVHAYKKSISIVLTYQNHSRYHNFVLHCFKKNSYSDCS